MSLLSVPGVLNRLCEHGSEGIGVCTVAEEWDNSWRQGGVLDSMVVMAEESWPALLHFHARGHLFNERN